MRTTVIYLTDNTLEEKIASLCRRNIGNAIGSLPLVSVSHQPIDFGRNICVGVMERSSLTINLQMMKALDVIDTEFIAIAEHDCLYTGEHFAFIPPDEASWYNENVWCLQTYSKDNPQLNGMFSLFKGRRANSQLICKTETMRKSTKDRIEMMGDPAWRQKYPLGRIGEAGAMDYHHAMRLARGESIAHVRGKLKTYIETYKGCNFRTKLPNVDIRHSGNFTKNRRGSKRRYELPPWGTMADIFAL